MKEELQRINGGYRPVSKAWYYQLYYYLAKLISIIVASVKNLRKPSFKYACPNCGKESNDSAVIFDCISDHEYNKGGSK